MGEGVANLVALALTCRVVAADPTLLRLVSVAAREAGRPVRPLHLQALLQLPRLADERGDVPVGLAEALTEELAAELPPERDWLIPAVPGSPRDLAFNQEKLSRVHDGMARFHYLRSPRKDGRAYSLRTMAGHVVAFCVSSPLDVKHLEWLLSTEGRPTGSEVRVISRVFAFELAPRNSISYLLGLAAQAERRHGATDLITYVNPNMGFTGSSYRASGWRLLGEEARIRYRYLDGRYVTDRVLSAAFGHHPDTTYQLLLGGRFALSAMPLAPLLIFHRQLL
jgi:hypothetical protein